MRALNLAWLGMMLGLILLAGRSIEWQFGNGEWPAGERPWQALDLDYTDAPLLTDDHFASDPQWNRVASKWRRFYAADE